MSTMVLLKAEECTCKVGSGSCAFFFSAAVRSFSSLWLKMSNERSLVRSKTPGRQLITECMPTSRLLVTR